MGIGPGETRIAEPDGFRRNVTGPDRKMHGDKWERVEAVELRPLSRPDPILQHTLCFPPAYFLKLQLLNADVQIKWYIN